MGVAKGRGASEPQTPKATPTSSVLIDGQMPDQEGAQVIEHGYIQEICGADDPEEVMQPYLCRNRASWVGTYGDGEKFNACDTHRTLWDRALASQSGAPEIQWEAHSQPEPNPQPRIIVIQHDDRGNEIAQTIPLDRRTCVIVERYDDDEFASRPGTLAQAIADHNAELPGIVNTAVYIGDYGIKHYFGPKEHK